MTVCKRKLELKRFFFLLFFSLLQPCFLSFSSLTMKPRRVRCVFFYGEANSRALPALQLGNNAHPINQGRRSGLETVFFSLCTCVLIRRLAHSEVPPFHVTRKICAAPDKAFPSPLSFPSDCFFFCCCNLTYQCWLLSGQQTQDGDDCFGVWAHNSDLSGAEWGRCGNGASVVGEMDGWEGGAGEKVVLVVVGCVWVWVCVWGVGMFYAVICCDCLHFCCCFC